MKSIFRSKTLLGIAVSLVAKLTGIPGGDFTDLIGDITALWPVLVGIVADVGSVFTRIKATDFDKSIFASKTFWLQIVSAAMTAAAAFGYDLSGLEAVIDKGIEHWPAIFSIAGSLFAIFGRLAATKKLGE